MRQKFLKNEYIIDEQPCVPLRPALPILGKGKGRAHPAGPRPPARLDPPAPRPRPLSLSAAPALRTAGAAPPPPSAHYDPRPREHLPRRRPKLLTAAERSFPGSYPGSFSGHRARRAAAPHTRGAPNPALSAARVPPAAAAARREAPPPGQPPPMAARNASDGRPYGPISVAAPSPRRCRGVVPLGAYAKASPPGRRRPIGGRDRIDRQP